MLLGEVLVREQGFTWATSASGDAGYAVVQSGVGLTVVLDEIAEDYAPDGDAADGGPFDLGDVICNAYERITLEVKRRKFGPW